MTSLERQSKNERLHVIEGALYISTGALISVQTMMPALIKRLGGGDVLVGTWPVVVYLAYFLPQIISANYSVSSAYRKSPVLQYGFIQRMHIFLLAWCIALWGASLPALALALLFLLYTSNQATSGSISPLWMDFLVKTTDPERRGKIMGWRVTLGAVLALINGFILTALLTWLTYPYNYASVIGLAFLLQMGSWGAQTKIIEFAPSPVSTPVHLSDLFSHAQTLVARNPLYKKFLLGSAMLTISFSSVAFFTIAAIKRFAISEYVIGLFTIMMIFGQIISGFLLGWLADAKGAKSALVVCGISLVLAVALAWLAPSVLWYYFVFFLFGINTGSETAMRYNFAVECAPLGERPMYVGVMNAWFAPFYLFTPLAGLLAALYGYNLVFAISVIAGFAGIALLYGMPNPRFEKLAVSSK